jgi:hypothetical protein
MTIWDLDAGHFFAMATAIDKERARRQREARKK